MLCDEPTDPGPRRSRKPKRLAQPTDLACNQFLVLEGEQLQALALGAHQVQREHRDQAHELFADALGLGVLGARHAGLRAGEIADAQVGHLPATDRRPLHRGIREAELGETGARVDRECLGDLHVDLVAVAQRLDDLQAGRIARAPQHAIDGADDRCLP
jgi:hypothetical protein